MKILYVIDIIIAMTKDAKYKGFLLVIDDKKYSDAKQLGIISLRDETNYAYESFEKLSSYIGKDLALEGEWRWGIEQSRENMDSPLSKEVVQKLLSRYELKFYYTEYLGTSGNSSRE